MPERIRPRLLNPVSWFSFRDKDELIQRYQFEKQVAADEGPLSPDRLEKALSTHNKGILSQFPVGQARLGPSRSPSSALVKFQTGETESFELFYNLKGQLDARSTSKIKSIKVNKLNTEYFASALSASQKRQISKLSKTVEKSYLYSTAAAPLALCRALRQQLEQGKELTFADLVPTFVERAKPLLAAYKGGTCLTIAEELATRISNQIKCNAYVVSANPQNNILTSWPSMVTKKAAPLRSAYEFLGHDTHTNVVVPYLRGNERRYLRIDAGVGPKNVIVRDWGDTEFNEMDGEIIINNPAALAAQSIRVLSKLHIKSYSSNATFGIDLLRGHMYINKSIQNTAALPDETNSIDLLTDLMPQEDKNLRTLKIINSLTKSFSLSRETIKDIEFLVNNLRQYVSQVLIFPAVGISTSIHQADAAIERLEKAREALLKSPGNAHLRSQVEQSEVNIKKAAALVFEGKAEEATALYETQATDLPHT